ncbi:hypothetical protein ACXWRS_11570, partial [Streptococcus pyogenes]
SLSRSKIIPYFFYSIIRRTPPLSSFSFSSLPSSPFSPPPLFPSLLPLPPFFSFPSFLSSPSSLFSLPSPSSLLFPFFPSP